MPKYKTAFFVIALSICLLNKQVIAANKLCEDELAKAAIPHSAFYLPENQASQLQKALNTHNIVRIKPGGNYRGSFKIKLGSNQALYGLAGTKLPQVIIPEGTTNAILSGVSPEKISFEGFMKPIRNNCLNRISNSKIEAKNVLLEDNLFTDLSKVTIDIDTSAKGYLKNNRFVRIMVHGAYPAIKIIGDSAKQSQDNQFIWTNMLTPLGDSIIIKNQKNVSFIGIDAEVWNWEHRAEYPGMLNVFDTDFLSVLLSSGGDWRNKTGQYFNLDAKDIILQGMNIGLTQKPGIILGNNVENFLTIHIQNIGLLQSNKTTQVIEIFRNSNPTIIENNQTILPENITDATKVAIADLVQSEKNMFNHWQKPVFNQIPDPAGSKWQSNLDIQPDSSETIQALIDRNNIAELDAGLYYISKPLILKKGQGIIGAGAEKTTIIAKSPTIDLITGASHANKKTMITTFVLADLTLQGGFNGINHSEADSGQGAQYHLITLSHVTFRDMANAGILMNNIFAWDNNFIDHTNFFRCKTGIKQRPDPNYAGGEVIGETFLDKNVFYQTQFVENELAIDWPAKRPNNLNAFVNSLFKNNGQVINQTNSDSIFFANSVFEAAFKQPLLRADRVTGFINSYFISNNPSNALFNGNVLCDNCRFDNSTAISGLIILPNSKNSFFINNTLSLPSEQPIYNGLILNSNFSGAPQKPIINSLINNQETQPF